MAIIIVRLYKTHRSGVNEVNWLCIDGHTCRDKLYLKFNLRQNIFGNKIYHKLNFFFF